MRINPFLTDDAVMAEFGQRLARARLARNMSQKQLAEEAGVGERTVARVEAGESPTLANVIRILRALDLVEGLDRLVPEPVVNPLARARAARSPAASCLTRPGREATAGRRRMDLGRRSRRGPMTLAEVVLWGTRIGAVSLPDGDRYATFAYDPDFLRSDIQVSPITMPLRSDPYRFPTLPPATFHGLPGLLADSLPDRYGNALIDAWLARQGRTPQSFDAVERLGYIGTRGMGALEFRPALGPERTGSTEIEIDALVELASEVLSDRPSSRRRSRARIARTPCATSLASAPPPAALGPRP